MRRTKEPMNYYVNKIVGVNASPALACTKYTRFIRQLLKIQAFSCKPYSKVKILIVRNEKQTRNNKHTEYGCLIEDLL